MNKKFTLSLLSVLLMGFVLFGCGKIVKTGTETGIEGYIFAADGVTPIAGALVSVTGPTYSTLTGVNGYFKLVLPIDGTVTKDVYVKKGVFSATLAAVVFESGKMKSVGDQNKKIYLDPNRVQPGITVQIGKIAVVTGYWDRMEDLLAKLGYGTIDGLGHLQLGTEFFDLYDGNDTLGATYEEFNTLVSSPGAMSQYKIIFINCGNNDESLLDNPTIVGNIKNYVNAGGSLYVTDLSYDFVEQVFPEYIDFYGSDTTPIASPETRNEAEFGYAGITVNAGVLDSTLKSWLQGRGALNPDGTVYISGFSSGWAMMNNVSSAAKVWVKGTVQYAATSGEKPLTVTFNYGNGKVLYTSYHTEDTPSTLLRPQEYVLAYLVFEL